MRILKKFRLLLVYIPYMKIVIKIHIFSLLLSLSSVRAAYNITRIKDNTSTLSGVVTDKADGKPIIGATINIPDIRVGTTTDINGHYSINNLPKGTFLVQISYIGYATFNQKLDFTKIAVFNVQLSESSIETSEVVITGVSKATELKRDPVPMTAVSKTFIDEHSASGNVIDEIANLPGISAVTTGPNISKPFIHGLGYNRVVTSVDGIRQEGQQWGDEHGIEVDQNSIDRVEIIKGPSSLSYGSDAIGGVVNLITPPAVQTGKILGSFTSFYGTNNSLLNESLRLQGNKEGIVWGTIMSYKIAKDYQNQHDGRVYATNFNEKDFRAMVGLSKTWGYSYFNASLFDDLQAIPDGSRDPLTRKFTKQITDTDTYRVIVPESELNSYTIPTLHQHVQLYRIYNNSSFVIGNGNLLVNLGYQYSHRREYTHPTNPDIPGLNLQLTTFTYDTKYNLSFGNGYEATAGLNGMYQSNTLGNSTAFPIPAYHQFDIGPFLVIKKSFGKLDLSGGLRYDSRSFSGQSAFLDTTNTFYPVLYSGSNPTSIKNIEQQFVALNKEFSGYSGSFGGSYNFSKEFLLKLNIARGFRAPSISELSANGPDPGSQIYHVGNSSFKPEFSLQEDFGILITLPKVAISVGVFNNDIQNYIYQQQVLNADGSPVHNPEYPLYNEFTYVQSKARINGGETGIDFHPVSWLHFENEATLTYGTNLGTGSHVADSIKYLPFIPPLHTHSELRFTTKKKISNLENLYAFIGFDYFGEQTRYFAAYATETYTASYSLLSAGIGSNIINKGGKKIIELFIEGTNLGNVNYQSNMSRLKYFDNPTVPTGVQPGIFNMGRNISFKIVIPFDLSVVSKPSDKM